MTRPALKQFVLVPERTFEVTYPDDDLFEDALMVLDRRGYAPIRHGQVPPQRFRAFVRLRRIVWTEPQKRLLNDSWLKAVEAGEILI